MPKKAKELEALAVSKLKAPGLHMVGVVAGLGLQVSATGARSWVLRAMVGGKRRDIGLGGYPDVTLAGAREKARQYRESIDQGKNPIDERRAAKSALQAAVSAALYFEDAAAQYITANEAEWRNAKHAQQWRNTLEKYAYPVIGRVLVGDIGLPQILAVLNPIWTTKTETATRVRGRMEAVLDWAIASQYRAGPNPARWRGHLDKILAKPSKVAKRKHHTALPLADLGAFMARLRAMEGSAARALEFAILTATRSGEVRGATWSEIDLDAAIWEVPAERMKAQKKHKVPLSDAALAILKAIERPDDAKPTDLVFPAPRGGTYSDMSLLAVTRRMKVAAVPISTYQVQATVVPNFK